MDKQIEKSVALAFYARAEALILKAEHQADKFFREDKRKRFHASARRRGRIL